MNLLNNFFKKLNNPVPAFVHTKLEKENNTEPSLSTKPKTTFRDVAGLEEIKEELFEVVDFMKFPEKHMETRSSVHLRLEKNMRKIN